MCDRLLAGVGCRWWVVGGGLVVGVVGNGAENTEGARQEDISTHTPSGSGISGRQHYVQKSLKKPIRLKFYLPTSFLTPTASF